MSTLAARQLVIDIPEREDGTPLDFTIQPGEIWAILGPNGAGKTTLLHTLAGLKAPRKGEVALNDQSLNQLRRKQIAREIAVVFQERQDGFPATVLETVLIGRHPYMAPWDVETAEDLELARAALERTQLSALEDRLVSTLSGGERQRLALATALCQQPAIWLADEPGNHLDLRHQVEAMKLFANEADVGRAVLLCLHDLNLAARWCTHILLLYPDGRACWGAADKMLERSALEKLYRQQLTETQVDGRRYFVPATDRIDD
ncbi:iron complex transport system ATP-binding protein [Litorivivens lipolytica]|uniref:Iron complex transport system ATP-binding protein n=1 Tax=Litorivivens lipolytica TaxID=1524264 RepID=A0A7W4W5V7_9GAMM|nr:ABC transporter ATP-binding protein [Litorivivens lipolytica]MBB3048041.1 iron complex transport system ATP-binding protein [Litorivivens lipolytica]